VLWEGPSLLRKRAGLVIKWALKKTDPWSAEKLSREEGGKATSFTLEQKREKE